MPTPKSCNEEALALQALEFDNKKKQIAGLEKEVKAIRVPLESAVDTLGSVTPTGSKVFALPYADKEIQLHKTLRLTSVLVPEAEDILRKNHLTECLETVTMVREDVIERLYQTGKIPRTSYRGYLGIGFCLYGRKIGLHDQTIRTPRDSSRCGFVH